MISSRAPFVVLALLPALATAACSLDTEQFAFQGTPSAAGGGGAAGTAGASGASGAPTAGAAGTGAGGATGGTAGAAGTTTQMGGAAGTTGGASGESGAGGGDPGGAAGGGGEAGAAGEAGQSGAAGEGGAAGNGGAGGAVDKPCTDQNFGEQRCNEKTIETCGDTGWTADPAPCPLECIDTGIFAVCKVCVPNTATCTGNRLDVCAADGRGSDPAKERTCGETPGTEDLPVCNATAGACQQCTEGDKICVGALSRTCSASGVYPVVGGDECESAALCTPTGCQAPACAVGELRCDNGGVKFCKGDRTGFGDTEACDVGQTCVDAKGCVECKQDDGVRFCEGDTLNVCNKGKKSAEATCAPGQCSDALQKCLACTDGVFQCDGVSLSECKNADFVFLKDCPSGLFCNSVAGGCVDCAPGSVRCDQLALQVCDAAGKYQTTQTCDRVCDAAGNECDECVPGETKCDGATLQVCNDRGKFEVSQTCDTAELCDATKKVCHPPACDAGARRCAAGAQPQQCNAGRTKWENLGAPCNAACIDFPGDSEQGCVATTAITAGPTGTCAIVGTSGRVVCWGALGAAAGREPYLRRDLGGVDDISFGSTHVCALAGGKVFCWGNNNNGQLGRDPATFPPTQVAVEIPFASGLKAAAISAVGNGTCATMANGELWCWGQRVNTTSWSHIPAKITAAVGLAALSAGGLTRCALSATKPANALCWGDDALGKLGNGTPATDLNDPNTPVLSPAATPAPLAGVTAIGVGTSHVCAVASGLGHGGGNVFCWGSNTRGALGLGTIDNNDHPKAAVLSITADQIGSGNLHSCAVTDKGVVSCWGSSDFGAHGSTVATVSSPQIVTVPVTSDLGVGSNHTCALVKGGDVMCWGNNGSKQLGSPLPTGTFTATPTKVPMP